MNDRNRNLDVLLAKARVRPRLVPEQDVRTLLQAAAPDSGSPAVAGDQISGTWKIGSIAGLAVALVVGSVSFGLWRGGSDDPVPVSVVSSGSTQSHLREPDAVVTPSVRAKEPRVGRPVAQSPATPPERHLSNRTTNVAQAGVGSSARTTGSAHPEDAVLKAVDTERRFPIEERSFLRGSPGIRMIELTDDELRAIGLEIIPDGEAALGFRLYKIDPNAGSTARQADSINNDPVASIKGTGRITVREELQPGRQIDVNRRLPLENGLRIITDNAGKQISRDNTRGDERFAVNLFDSLLKVRPMRRAATDEVEQDGGYRNLRSLLRDGTLLPIRVPLGRRDSASAMAPPPTHVVFWCRLTPDLFSSLPVRFRRVVLQELAHSARLRNNEPEPILESLQRSWATMTLGELRDRAFLADPDLSPGTEEPLPGPDNRPTLFGTGERRDGAISVTSMSRGNSTPPMASSMQRANDQAPARGLSISLRYRLDAPRSVSVMVHDIHGRRIGQAAATQTRAAGSWTVPLAINDLPAGIYLVVLSTDLGERVTQRVVVE